MSNAYYPEQNLSAVYIQEKAARTRKGAKKADLEACCKGGGFGLEEEVHWYKAVGMQMHTF